MEKLRILGLTLLFLAAVGFTASGWNPVLKISTDPGDGWHSDKHPQIAVSASGISSIVWERFFAPQWTICWVRVSPSGIVGTLQMLSTHPIDGSWDHPSPQVAVDSQGNSGVVWSGYDGHDWEVYWVKIDSSGVPGVVQKLSILPENETGNDRYPHVVADSAGNFYVVWHGYDGNDYEVYWVKIASSGVPGNIQKISTHPDNITRDDTGPQIAADSAGNTSVIWSGDNGNNYDIYWVKVNSAGVPGVVQKISTHPDNVTENDGSSQIAVDFARNSYVVWWGSDGHDDDIYWVKVNSAGVPGVVQKISTHPDNVNNGNWIPRIAVDFAGNSYVVWWGSDGHDYEVYWVKIASSGIPGPVQKISTHPDNVDRDAYLPQIAADSAGNTCVVWEGYDGHHNHIYWVKINSSSIPGPVQKISTHPDNLAWGNHHPQIALDHRGNCYVTWDGYDGDLGRIYLVSNNVYPLIPAITDNLKPPNQQMQPLAQYRISKAEALQNQIQTLLSTLPGVDTSDCQKLIEKGDQFLALAKNSFAGGNYIAANILALNAIDAYKEALAFLESVTG